ncbi:LysE family translocator [Catenuloplanes sp. NPDC051500]|uniref:LysE family translocator n=1 Tax=Catenuloplanes sp. NPDC051500 TaxID=3363959 RepID=UPI0037A8B48C
MHPELIWSFVLVVGLLTITPGLDTALILRTAAVGHVRRAWGTAAGIQLGTLTWGVLTSAGVTALLTASQLAYDVLRWAGAAYLLWMGLRMIWTARRGPAPEAEVVPGGFLSGVRQGMLTNLLNPKVGVFYVALLPQFIPASAPHFAWGVMLAVIHIVLGTVWSGLLIAFAARIRVLLRRPVATRILDRVTGTVIAAFGLRLALSSN